MTAQEFKQAFLPHHRVLYRVAYHLTGSVEDAEDLVQDLYLRLWMRRDEMDEARRTQAYLVTMIRNLYLDRMRLKRSATWHREHTIIDNGCADEPPDHDTPERQLIARDNSQRMQELVEQLPEREQTVIQLHADELSYQEIEQATSLTQSNLRVIVMRTKQKLRQQFENISKTWKS